MAGSGSKWLVGCGIGCGAIVLIAVALIAAGALFVKDTARGFDEAVGSRLALDERFGEPASFTPWTGGAVPSDRVEAFLAVREAADGARSRLAERFETLESTREQAEELENRGLLDKLRFARRAVGAGLGLGADLGDFFRARNEALLDAGMGMGEYTWIYVLAYHSFLGHSPSDGPLADRVRVETGPEGRVATGTEWARKRIREETLAMLRNARDAIDREAGARTEAAWRDEIEAEIERMEADPARLPWPGDPPPAVARSLDPYRERLESTYDPVTHPFELARNRRSGRWSIRGE